MPFSVQPVILSLPRCALNPEWARPQQDMSPHHLSQERPWPHRGNSQLGPLAGTKLKIHGPHRCRQRWQQPASLGSPGLPSQGHPTGSAGAAACQPLPSGTPSLFCSSCPQRQHHLLLPLQPPPPPPRRQGSRGTGPLGCVLETSVCSEQAVPAPGRRGSQQPACTEPIMSCGQVLRPAYKTLFSQPRRPPSHITQAACTVRLLGSLWPQG